MQYVVEFNSLSIRPVLNKVLNCLQEIESFDLLVHFEIVNSILILSLSENKTHRNRMIEVKVILSLGDDDVFEHLYSLVNWKESVEFVWAFP